MNISTLFFLAVVTSQPVPTAQNKIVSGDYSIYSVNTGSLIYSIEDTVNSYVYGLTAYYVDKYASTSKELERAGWAVQESSYSSGLFTIKNKFTNLCLSLYGSGYQVVQDNCYVDKGEQLWELKENIPNDRSYMIRSSTNPEICIYSWPGDSDYYVYTDKCTSYRNVSDWAFIPIIKRGYFNP